MLAAAIYLVLQKNHTATKRKDNEKTGICGKLVRKDRILYKSLGKTMVIFHEKHRVKFKNLQKTG